MEEALLSNVKVDLRMMGYTKVPNYWLERDRRIKFNRFYLICDGDGYVEIDGKRYLPKVGDLVLLPANQIISVGTLNSNTYLKYWCHFDAKIGEYNLFDYINLPLVIEIEDYAHAVDLFKQMLCCYKREDLYSLLTIKGLLTQLIAQYIKEGKERTTVATSISSFDENTTYILHFIERNLSTTLNVKILAEQLNFHPNHFIRYFKASLGVSPMKYILSKRMKQAEFLLISSYLTITEIALKVGYPNIYHFSKAFKAYTGYSPSDYRNYYKNIEPLEEKSYL